MLTCAYLSILYMYTKDDSSIKRVAMNKDPKRYLSWDINKRWEFASNLEVFAERCPKWIKVAQELLNIQAVKRKIEDKEQECKRRLIEMSGNVESRAGNFRFFPTWKRGPLDFDRMPNDFKLQLERYRKDNVGDWILIYEIIGSEEVE